MWWPRKPQPPITRTLPRTGFPSRPTIPAILCCLKGELELELELGRDLEDRDGEIHVDFKNPGSFNPNASFGDAI